MEPRRLTKQDIDKVRHIEGFPIAADEDIIALSAAPYYTSCPNPFIGEFIEKFGTPYDEETDDYHREPFAADVSEGKNDPIYNAHSYHTKVPHKAIMRYILYYTNPGDIVFDGFCGTGMTGVAAQMCGNPDIEFKQKIEEEMPGIEWGERKSILNDLSPAATFIAYNYNTPVDVEMFREEAEQILKKVEKECGWMYETQHVIDGKTQLDLDRKPIKGHINYTVWSDVFICPTCSNEMVFWDIAVDKKRGKVLDVFTCPHCNSSLKKRDCQRALETHFDNRLGRTVTMAKQVPVLINYSIGKKRFEKTPDEYDLALIKKIEAMDIPYWYPTDRMCEGRESRRNDRFGITHVHQFYTKRNLHILSYLWNSAKGSVKFLISSFITRNAMKTNRYFVGKYSPSGSIGRPLTGTLYIPSEQVEQSPFNLIKSKIKYFGWDVKYNIVTCQSSTNLPIPNNSVDYIFIDPPFGGNMMYSELNFLSESWLKIFTSNTKEAIENKTQGKSLKEYQFLMTDCFKNFYRKLKPGRWMTVEFHNSKNSVWNAIQEALMRAGFIIADVRILDKKHGGIKASYMLNSVKRDLVISAYKPKESFKREFTSKAGREETVWMFVRQHLEQLPKVVLKNQKIEILSERQDFLLFDRMVAYHIMQGLPIPLDAADFYRGLNEKFLNRDGMYFLPDQVNEYDKTRIKHDIEHTQMEMFVTNEKNAILWLYQQLKSPQTYADIQPKFMQEVKTVDKFEEIPELAVLLEENFLQNERGSWYIPDITKEGDLIKLREKKLWKEFDGYLNSKGRLRLFRSEAIRAGFARLWKEQNYKAIVDFAERLPDETIQEDPNLLMYYDISLNRL